MRFFFANFFPSNFFFSFLFGFTLFKYMGMNVPYPWIIIIYSKLICWIIFVIVSLRFLQMFPCPESGQKKYVQSVFGLFTRRWMKCEANMIVIWFYFVFFSLLLFRFYCKNMEKRWLIKCSINRRLRKGWCEMMSFHCWSSCSSLISAVSTS